MNTTASDYSAAVLSLSRLLGCSLDEADRELLKAIDNLSGRRRDALAIMSALYREHRLIRIPLLPSSQLELVAYKTLRWDSGFFGFDRDYRGMPGMGVAWAGPLALWWIDRRRVQLGCLRLDAIKLAGALVDCWSRRPSEETKRIILPVLSLARRYERECEDGPNVREYSRTAFEDSINWADKAIREGSEDE